MRTFRHRRSGVTPQGLLFVLGCALLGFAVETPMTKSGTATTVPPRYAVIDLGPNFTPTALNNSNVVVGNGPSGAAVWSQGVLTTLPYPSTAISPGIPGQAAAINDSGEIVGSATYYLKPYPGIYSGGVLETHACYWANTNTAPVDLDWIFDPNNNYWGLDPTSWNYWSGGLPAYPIGLHNSYTAGIGSNHAIYGYSETFSWDLPAQFSTNASWINMPAWVNDQDNLGIEGTLSSAAGTNYLGSYNYEFSSEAPGGYAIGLIINGAQIPVSTNAYAYVGASAINQCGVAVGYGWLTDSAGPGASIFNNGVIGSLAGPGYPYGLNDLILTNIAGGVTNVAPTPQIVGQTGWGNSGSAVLWDQLNYDGSFSTNASPVPKNLNALIAQPSTNSSINLTSAIAINDSGVILANGTSTPIPFAPVPHGYLLLPDYITRDNKPITGTNANVWVGQQICLTNMVMGSPTNSIVTSYQWHIPGVTGSTNDPAFYDYEPNQVNSNYTNLVTPTNYTTNSYINFYYCGDATNLPVSCTQTIYGQTTTVSATLNIQRPNAIITTSHGIIAVNAGGYEYLPPPNDDIIDPSTALHFGSVLAGATPGMKFGVDPSVFPAGSSNATNIIWNQVINGDFYTTTSATGTETGINSGGYDSGAVPGQSLGDYPYSYDYDESSNSVWVSDSPADPGLLTNYTSDTRSFTATMYLMWQPSPGMVGGDKTATVPLRCWPWHWDATATNGAPSAGWGLKNSTYPNTTSDVDVTSPPIWTNGAPYAWKTYKSGSL